MARKSDVELVIRARDAATQAVSAVTKAVNGLIDSQDNLKKSADKSDTALSKLGAAFDELDKQLRGATVGAQVAKALDQARNASDRLEASVRETKGELSELEARSNEAAQGTRRLNQEMQRTASAVDKEAAALKRAEAAVREQGASLRKATTDRDKLIAADERLTRQITEQQGELDIAAQRHRELGAEIARTVTPTKTLQAAFDRSSAAVDRQQLRLLDLRETQGVVRAAIGQTEGAINRFSQGLDRANQSFARQESSLAGTRQEYVQLQAAAKTAAQHQRQLDESADKTAESLSRQEAALGRSQVEMRQLAAAAGQADAALGELAAGSTAQLQTAFNQQRRSMLETRREWAQAEAQIKGLTEGMVRIGPPTREQAIAWNQATVAARAAKAEYQAQRVGLEQLSRILREIGGDVNVLRERLQRFAQAQATTGAAIARIRTEAAQSVASYERLAQSADRAATATRRVGTGAGAPPVGPVNALSEAYRRLYGNTRQAMSWTQRLRGEVLSLVAAYAGIYGIINLFGEIIKSYRVLEAAQNRLGVVFKQDFARAGKELDFLRRNADRLGITFSILSDEYSKFAVAADAANFSNKATREIFLSVAEAARVNKLSVEQMSGVFLALQQIISKGKFTSEEVRRQLGDRLAGAFNILADALGMTTAELDAAMKAGEVFATESNLLKFSDELTRRFGPQLAEALKSTTTEIGKFENASFQALLRLAQGGFIEAFTELMRDLTETFKSADFAAFLDSISAGLAVLIDALGLAVQNFDLVVIAATAFAGIKLTPLIVALWASLVKLNTGLGVTTARMVTATGAMAGAATTANVAALSFSRLALSIRALLATTGPGLAITAIAAGIGYWVTRADAASEAMTAHRKIVDDVKTSYDSAGKSTEKWGDEIRNATQTQAAANLRRLRDALREVQNEQIGLIAGGSNALSFDAGVRRQSNELIDLAKKWRDGRITVEEYREAVDRIGQSAADERIKELAERLLDASNAGIEATRAIEEAEAVIALMKNPADEAAKAVLGLASAMDSGGESAEAGRELLDKYTASINKLKEAVPELAEELKYLKDLAAIDEAFEGAINASRSVGQANAAFAAREQAIAALNAGRYEEAANALGRFTDGIEASAELIRRREGFIATPAFDVNADRVGFGSDTITLADGTIKKVVDGMRVSVADANRDLYRRINSLHASLEDAIGPAFRALNPQQQAVLASLAYNYGSGELRPGGDLAGIVEAVREGTTEGVVAAIQARAGDNGGVNRNRRNEEAAIFASNAGVEAQTQEFLNNEKERLETLKKAREEAEKFHASRAEDIKQQEFELSIRDRELIQRETAKALREAENAAKAAGTQLTEAERQKIIEVTEAKYRDQAADEARNAVRERAAEAEQKVNDLLTQRSALQEQLKIHEEEGDQGAVERTRLAIEGVNTELQAAIENAIKMWQAVGGTGADAAISKLQTAALEAKNLANSGKQSFIDWSRVGQLFASGLANAFDTFAKAVAEGKNIGEAAREAFLQFAADFLRQIAQMIIQQAILNALKSIGGGKGGGFLSGLFHGGGVVGHGGNQRRSVSPGVFAGAMRYHGGGVVGLRPGEVPGILKQREEVLAEDDPRNILNGGGLGGGTQAPVNLRNINVFDPAEVVEKALRSRVGEQVFLNFVRDNPQEIKMALEGGT